MGQRPPSADPAALGAPARHILITAQRASDFAEMRRVAEALSERGHGITFLFHAQAGAEGNDRSVLEALSGLEASGVLRAFEVEGPGAAPPASGEAGTALGALRGQGTGATAERGDRGALASRAQALLRRNPRLLRIWRSTSGPVLSLAVAALAYRRRLKRYETLVGRLRPDVIVLPEDVVGPITPLLIRAGHDCGVPSVIVPYTMANQEEAFRSLRSRPAHRLDAGANAIAGRLFPAWTLRRKGEALLRLPAPHILGHALTGTSPPDPWMMNSGFANRIAVESEVMRDYYTRSGLPESKLRVVGTISDDCLARAATNRRQELDRLGEEVGQTLRPPLLVIGGCPNQLGSSPGFSFSGYEEMVAHMLECMAPLREHYTLVMRPHPNFLGLARLFEARGVPCSVSDTARLVAVADAYVAFASATIRWAIALGIPSVNYDAFHYDYDDYRSVRGVLHAAEPDEFRAAVARLLPAHPGYSALREACREEASRWGRLDGRSAERIEALIQEVCSERPLRRSSR